MKIETLTDELHDGKGGRLPPGTVVEVDDEAAAVLIERGVAVAVSNAAKAPAPVLKRMKGPSNAG